MNKKYNTRFTADISPRKERKPGQVRISEKEEAHNADMRALAEAKKMHDRLKKRCITIRVGDLTITGLPAVILALLVLAASMYLAIVLYHEARWRQAKSDKYEQHNR